MENKSALVLLMGFVGGLLITHHSIKSTEHGMILWSLYILFSGLILGKSNNTLLKTLAVSTISGVLLVLTILFRWVLTGVTPAVSGEINEPSRLALVLILLIPAGSIGIYLSAMGSEPVLRFLRVLIESDTNYFEKIRKNLKEAFAIIVILGFIFTYLSGDSTTDDIQKIFDSQSDKKNKIHIKN